MLPVIRPQPRVLTHPAVDTEAGSALCWAELCCGCFYPIPTTRKISNIYYKTSHLWWHSAAGTSGRVTWACFSGVCWQRVEPRSLRRDLSMLSLEKCIWTGIFGHQSPVFIFFPHTGNKLSAGMLFFWSAHTVREERRPRARRGQMERSRPQTTWAGSVKGKMWVTWVTTTARNWSLNGI